jgi:hypothetical protein
VDVRWPVPACKPVVTQLVTRTFSLEFHGRRLPSARRCRLERRKAGTRLRLAGGTVWA